MKIRTENLNSVAPLFHQFDGQIFPQPAYIEIDPRGDEITVKADYSGEVGNSVPAHVYNGLIRRIDCPARVFGEALIEYLNSKSFKNHIIELCKGYDGDWNQWATITAEEIKIELESLLMAEIFDGEDWVEGTVKYFDKNDDLCDIEEAVSAMFNGTEITTDNLEKLIEDVEYDIAPYQIVIGIEEAFMKIINDLNN